jgi:hypothetical protein
LCVGSEIREFQGVLTGRLEYTGPVAPLLGSGQPGSNGGGDSELA